MGLGSALNIDRDLPGDELDQPGTAKQANLLPEVFLLAAC
jgi:hypothetical protein